MTRVLGFVLVLSYGTLGPAWATHHRGSLTVHIESLERAEGSVCVALWTGEGRGFPSELRLAADMRCVAVHDHVASVTFGDLVSGRYAAMAFHDRNDNRRLDRNLLGIPREHTGIAFQDLQRGHRSLPSFRDAAFDVPAGTRTIAIHLHGH